MPEKVIIIGSGPAGQRAAVQAAKLGKRAAVIEKRLGLGGESLFTGTIPSKTFREAVMFYSSLGGHFDRRDRPRSGSRPQVDDLLGRVEEVFTKRNTPRLISNQRRKDVPAPLEPAAQRSAHSLLAFAYIDPTNNLTGLVEARELGLQSSGLDHGMVGPANEVLLGLCSLGRIGLIRLHIGHGLRLRPGRSIRQIVLRPQNEPDSHCQLRPRPP